MKLLNVLLHTGQYHVDEEGVDEGMMMMMMMMMRDVGEMIASSLW